MSERPFRILGIQQIAIGGPEQGAAARPVGRLLRARRSPATTSASARTSTRTSRCWAPASRSARST